MSHLNNQERNMLYLAATSPAMNVRLLQTLSSGLRRKSQEHGEP